MPHPAKSLAAVVAFIAAAAVPVLAQTPRPWPAGEQLRFRLAYGLVPAGEATMRVEGPVDHGGRPCWRLSADVVTSPLVSSLYRVRDRLETLADTTTLACLRSRVSLQEGGYRERLATDLDPERGIAVDQRGRRVRVPAGCPDVLAAWYRVRMLGLGAGDTLSLPVLAGRRVGRLRVAFAGREALVTAGGRRACLVLSTSLQGVAPEQVGRTARVWVTDDARRLPVRIEIAAPLGRIVATLEDRP